MDEPTTWYKHADHGGGSGSAREPLQHLQSLMACQHYVVLGQIHAAQVCCGK